jgi:hypothetical protein
VTQQTSAVEFATETKSASPGKNYIAVSPTSPKLIGFEYPYIHESKYKSNRKWHICSDWLIVGCCQTEVLIAKMMQIQRRENPKQNHCKVLQNFVKTMTKEQSNLLSLRG